MTCEHYPDKIAFTSIVNTLSIVLEFDLIITVTPTTFLFRINLRVWNSSSDIKIAVALPRISKHVLRNLDEIPEQGCRMDRVDACRKTRQKKCVYPCEGVRVDVKECPPHNHKAERGICAIQEITTSGIQHITNIIQTASNTFHNKL